MRSGRLLGFVEKEEPVTRYSEGGLATSLPGAQGRNRTTDTVIFSHVAVVGRVPGAPYWFGLNYPPLSCRVPLGTRLTLLPDLIRYRRSDASLVRVITPILSQDGGAEREQALQFTRAMFPLLQDRFKATE